MNEETNKTIEKYKKTLTIRICLLSVLMLFAVLLGIFHTFYLPAKLMTSEIFSFQCGIIIGLGLMSLILIIRYSQILPDNTALQKQYNKENDERMKAIRAKAGMPMLLITSVLMIVAGILIGYLNIYVFYTLIAAAFCQLLMGCIVKFIFIKKS